mgnify:CR=1 FL=1
MAQPIDSSGRTPFIGREAELERLRHLLDGDERLVTITGPPGMGKTRLARSFAAQCGGAPDSSWSGHSFADLSAAWTIDDIVSTRNTAA